MRTGSEIVEAIKSIFAKYDEQFPKDAGFADNEVSQIMKRTKSRRRTDFLDAAVDALALTDEEMAAWEQHHDDENSRKAEELFNKLIETKDFCKAEYIINNMKSRWDVEKRKAMAKQLGDEYDINPYSGLVDTKHAIKKETKQREKAG